jgi:hypothetical protein
VHTIQTPAAPRTAAGPLSIERCCCRGLAALLVALATLAGLLLTLLAGTLSAAALLSATLLTTLARLLTTLAGLLLLLTRTGLLLVGVLVRIGHTDYSSRVKGLRRPDKINSGNPSEFPGQEKRKAVRARANSSETWF